MESVSLQNKSFSWGRRCQRERMMILLSLLTGLSFVSIYSEYLVASFGRRSWNLHQKQQQSSVILPGGENSDSPWPQQGRGSQEEHPRRGGDDTTATSKSGSHHTQNLTIVIQLSGELGNHLAKIAGGLGVALWWNDLLREQSSMMYDHHHASWTDLPLKEEDDARRRNVQKGNSERQRSFWSLSFSNTTNLATKPPHFGESASNWRVDLMLRHQTRPFLLQPKPGRGDPMKMILKGQRSMADLQRCFPHLRPLNFSQGNTKEFEQQYRRQMDTFPLLSLAHRTTVTTTTTNTTSTSDGENVSDSSFSLPAEPTNSSDPWTWPREANLQQILNGINQAHADSIQSTLLWLYQSKSILQQQFHSNHLNARNDTRTEENRTVLSNMISFPFLYSNRIAGLDAYVDRYYEQYRQFFSLDTSESCCLQRAYPRETVVHIRNFVYEMPRKGRVMGYEEISPAVLAHVVLADLKPGDPVAVVTRYPDAVHKYIHALQQERNLSVRLIQNQTAMQDFCFLQTAKYQLIGLARSTFFFWAALLGQAATVRAYSVDSAYKRALLPEQPVLDSYPFTHPSLKGRIRFELFPADL